MSDEEDTITRDCNGNQLHDGDTVHLIKDLKVKGTNTTLKQGTKVKSIRLTHNPEEVECRVDNIKGLVFETRELGSDPKSIKLCRNRQSFFARAPSPPHQG